MPAMVTTQHGEVLATNKAFILYAGNGEGQGQHVFDEVSSETLKTIERWGQILSSERGLQGGYLDATMSDFRRAERFDIALNDQSVYLIKLVVANPIGLTATEQYQQMFMSHCSAMLVVDVKTLKIMDANAAAASLYMTTRDTLLCLTLSELEVIHSTCSDYEGYTLHTHTIGGDLRTMESYGSRHELHGSGTIFLTIHDVTEREQAHKMLSTQERLLSTGEAVCRIGCWEWNNHTGDRAWTRQMHEILGEEESLGFEQTLARVDERDKLRFELFFECLMDYDEVTHLRNELNKCKSDGFSIEFRYIKPDGKLIHLEMRLEVVLDHDLKQVEILRGSLQDITEMREREAEISHYARKLERVNKSLEEFTSMASHDLREPARKVVAFGERLMRQQRESLDDRGKTYLDRMIKAGQRMDGMINSLLELSTCSPEVSRKVHQINLNELLTDVASILEVRVEEAGARIDLVGAHGVIEGDYGQLTHLFQNLIGNAIKFTRCGELPRIKVTSECLGGSMIRVIVRDQGIGMPQDYVSEIFKPFKRLHGKCSDYKGNGIGLSICKKIVEAHGGKISVMSEPGVGSSFMVDLPVPTVD